MMQEQTVAIEILSRRHRYSKCFVNFKKISVRGALRLRRYRLRRGMQAR